MKKNIGISSTWMSFSLIHPFIQVFFLNLFHIYIYLNICYRLGILFEVLSAEKTNMASWLYVIFISYLHRKETGYLKLTGKAFLKYVTTVELLL